MRYDPFVGMKRNFKRRGEDPEYNTLATDLFQFPRYKIKKETLITVNFACANVTNIKPYSVLWCIY